MRRITPLIMLIIWCGMIYYFSDQPDLSINDNRSIDFILRKSAHMFVYLVLTVLAFNVAKDTLRIRNKTLVYAIAAGFALLYAVSDEWHQTFIEGRTGQASDVAIDMLGTSIAIIALILARRARKQ